MFELLQNLNDHGLPYPDTIHPIIVHFVIAMVLFAFVCDIIGNFSCLVSTWYGYGTNEPLVAGAEHQE